MLMASSDQILLHEPLEGLAPAVISEVLQAFNYPGERAAIPIVEHKADLILPMADPAYAMVNGGIAENTVLQSKLLGVVH